MNRFTLRLSWLAVKAAQLLFPIVWNMVHLAVYSFILFILLLFLVIIL